MPKRIIVISAPLKQEATVEGELLYRTDKLFFTIVVKLTGLVSTVTIQQPTTKWRMKVRYMSTRKDISRVEPSRPSRQVNLQF